MATTYLARAAWNARPPRSTTSFPNGRPLGVACHWPGTTTKFRGRTRDQIASSIRGWQDFHMDDRGWSDIAYSVAIDPAGRVWQLRGLKVRSAANGGTQPNADWLAALWVLGQGEDPTPAQIQAFRDWRRDRVLATWPGAGAVKTHNDVRPEPTACPGPDVTRLVRSGSLLRAADPEEEHPLAGMSNEEIDHLGDAVAARVHNVFMNSDTIVDYDARDAGATGDAANMSMSTAISSLVESGRSLRNVESLLQQLLAELVLQREAAETPTP